MSVLIKGGRVITAADDYVGDVYIEDETVSLIGESLDVEADKVIDASGKYVLPGCVDPHTHLDMPFGGTTTIDDVESGQTAAAFGGTTCHVDFIIQPPGLSFADAFADWRSKADGKQVIGGGANVFPNDVDDVLVRDAYPSSATGFYVEAQEVGAVADNWRIAAYAVCATVAP